MTELYNEIVRILSDPELLEKVGYKIKNSAIVYIDVQKHLFEDKPHLYHIEFSKLTGTLYFTSEDYKFSKDLNSEEFDQITKIIENLNNFRESKLVDRLKKLNLKEL